VAQDARVLAGEVIENVMELQLFANRQPGWCLTCKRPIVENGRVVGLIGISRDLGQRGGLESQYEPLRLALEYLNTHYAENVRMQTLLDITGFSLSKLERSFRKCSRACASRLRCTCCTGRTAWPASARPAGSPTRARSPASSRPRWAWRRASTGR
jgi:hypothetical protein